MTKARDLGDNAQNTKPKVVDAKGDLIVGTGSDAANRLAAGSNGETLVADSSTTTGLRYTAGNAQGNPVLNSAMQIAQRGTSFSIAANTMVDTLDRWRTYIGNTGIVISQQLTGDTTNLPSIQYCVRLQRTNGQTGTSLIQLTQNFETINSIPFAGKTVTVSFYARRGANYSQVNNQLGFSLYTGTGTDQNLLQNYTGAAQPVNAAATLTTTWQRFSFTGTIASNVTEIAPYFAWQPSGTAGANDWCEITGVQIDVGSVALPFRTYSATLAGELAACQRYYWRTTGQAATNNDLMTGWANSTTSAVGILRFPVTMRTAATGNFSAAGDFSFVWSAGVSTITGAAIDRISSESMNLRLTTTGLTTGQGGAMFLQTGTTKWLEASAEL